MALFRVRKWDYEFVALLAFSIYFFCSHAKITRDLWAVFRTNLAVSEA
jgi:hypothetical protein